MTAQDCLQTLREIRDVAFATVDEKGRPQIRIIDVMLVDEKALYFCTARGKAFYQQLLASGRVALTGMTPAYQMVRLSGRARRLPEQTRWIDRIFAENPSMNTVYPGDSRYILEPFCIENARIEWFDLGLSPIRRAGFLLGEPEAEAAGYHIAAACIGCGRCRELCPQQCVAPGVPYHIRQESCLRCGLCAENCPVEAIGCEEA